MARMAGAVVRPVKLALPDFHLPKEELAAAFSPKTKLILVNSPHNPSGKVFDLEELQFIADLCIKNDVIVLSDEVRGGKCIIINHGQMTSLLPTGVRASCLWWSQAHLHTVSAGDEGQDPKARLSGEDIFIHSMEGERARGWCP